jgi:glycyl-tRNA synthetase
VSLDAERTISVLIEGIARDGWTEGLPIYLSRSSSEPDRHPAGLPDTQTRKARSTTVDATLPKMTKLTDLKDIVSLSKRRGFVFPGSEIYGGLANTWDYGPYGVELKRNLKDLWWKHFVTRRDDVVGLDSGILLNTKVWEASGHLKSFSDPLMDCKKCRARERADHLVEAKLGSSAVAGKSNAELFALVNEHKIVCPSCGKLDWTEPRAFNLMFKTEQGVVEGAGAEVYLRPETAQGIFVDFKSIVEGARVKVPFGVGQIGKSFRNEITPGNFTFRTREFEQMELEFFCNPGDDARWYAHWKDYCMNFLLNVVGIGGDKLRLREHEKEELSFYSSGTCDIEYEFPFGWGELWGIACRTDYDLKQHSEHSGQDMRYHDKVSNERYTPWVVEPALGADRLALMTLCDAYDLERLENGEDRTVLRFSPRVAPVKAAILPLYKKPEQSEVAQKLYHDLLDSFPVEYDETQAVGKRYRRQDEIGTPFCVTVDFDTVGQGEADKKDTVTIRERDKMTQDRVDISQVEGYLREHIK